MRWKIEYTKEAFNDLNALDNTQQIQVIKTIKKVSENPLPKTEGGYMLWNSSRLDPLIF